jgi:hypothetical protein
MTPETASTNVVARYEPRRGGWPLVLISGVLFLGLIVYSLIGQSGEERLVTIVLLAVLATGIGSVGIVMAFVGLRAVEATASGTLDFVSRIKRESFPRTALMRVEGKTTASENSRGYWAVFIFTAAGPKEIEKKVHVPREDDPALQGFVRQLERLNPKLDASQFWAWSRGGEA